MYYLSVNPTKQKYPIALTILLYFLGIKFPVQNNFTHNIYNLCNLNYMLYFLLFYRNDTVVKILLA